MKRKLNLKQKGARHAISIRCLNTSNQKQRKKKKNPVIIGSTNIFILFGIFTSQNKNEQRKVPTVCGQLTLQ